MRWVLFLLLVGCAPDRVGTTIGYTENQGSFKVTSASDSGYDRDLVTSTKVDMKPAWHFGVYGEWDWGGHWFGKRDMSWLPGHGHERGDRYPLPRTNQQETGSENNRSPENNQTGGEHGEHSEFIHVVDKASALGPWQFGMLMVALVAGLAIWKRKDLGKAWARYKDGREGKK